MRILLSVIAFLGAQHCSSAEEVRLINLDPPEAQQYIDKQDTTLKYAPKIESSVPAVRFLGNEPHNVLEDIYQANQYHGQDGLGGYLYGYSVPDIAKTEKKKAGGDLRGAYNYITGNGEEIKVEYWDDGTGFHQVDNVPKILPKQIEDTPEVKAAKEEHQRLWNEQAERNSRPIENPYDSNGNYAQAPLSPQGQAQTQAQQLVHQYQQRKQQFPNPGQNVHYQGDQPGHYQSQSSQTINRYQPSGQISGASSQGSAQFGGGPSTSGQYGGGAPAGGQYGATQPGSGHAQFGSGPSGGGQYGGGVSTSGQYGGAQGSTQFGSSTSGSGQYGGGVTGSGQGSAQFGSGSGASGQYGGGASGSGQYGGVQPGSAQFASGSSGSGQYGGVQPGGVHGGGPSSGGQYGGGISGGAQYGGAQSGGGRPSSSGQYGGGQSFGAGQYGSQSSSGGQYGSSNAGGGQYGASGQYGGAGQGGGHSSGGAGQYGGSKSFGGSGQFGGGGQHNSQYSGSSSQASGQYASGQYSGDQEGKWNDEEENNGPPKGFFYSFDYPVGIIVSKDGGPIQKREGDLRDIYATNKANFEKQLQEGHSDRSYRSATGYLVV